MVISLTALCCTLGLDPTLWPLSATTTGRVLTSMGRQAGLREAAAGCGAIRTFSPTAFTAVPAVAVCIDPHLPEDMEGALLAAGVEPDAVNTLDFDVAHGPVFRQRIKGKWRTFCDLVTRGLVQNPTGFFVSPVRKNWMLSSSYVPGLKKAAVISRAELERVELQIQREADAGLHQQQVELEQQRLRLAVPEEQWRASRSVLCAPGEGAAERGVAGAGAGMRCRADAGGGTGSAGDQGEGGAVLGRVPAWVAWAADGLLRLVLPGVRVQFSFVRARRMSG
jgi:hypothetical protein